MICSTCSTVVLTWSTPLPMYSCSCRCPQVSIIAASHPAFWSLGPSPAFVLHCFQSLGKDPHDLHLCRRPPSLTSTPTQQTKRHAPGFEAQTGKLSTCPIWTWHTPSGVNNQSRRMSLIQSLRLDLGPTVSITSLSWLFMHGVDRTFTTYSL